MQVPNPQLPVERLIWVCGKPRFLLESLCHVLQETVRTYQCELPGTEPPELNVGEQVQWLIWFPGSHYPLSGALNEFTSSNELNVVLIEQNGNTLVHRADGTETRQLDISLNDLVRILQMPLPEHG